MGLDNYQTIDDGQCIFIIYVDINVVIMSDYSYIN